MAVQEAIIKIRKALLMEQEELANELGVTVGSICNYEKGRRTPRPKTLRLLLELAKKHKLKVTAEDLM